MLTGYRLPILNLLISTFIMDLGVSSYITSLAEMVPALTHEPPTGS